VGTVRDLSCQQIKLQEGLELILYSEELEVKGQVQYSSKESIWVAAIDWDAIREIESDSHLHQELAEEKHESA
jgi:hypothetical protein